MGKDFDVDSNGFVNVYTDGSCLDTGTPRAKAGIGVWFCEGSRLNVSAPVVGPADNNVAETQAVTKAAQVARGAGITKLRVLTDSEGVILKNFTDPMHKHELQKMESALKGLEVKWQHVLAHKKIRGNNEADRLAGEGAKQYKGH